MITVVKMGGHRRRSSLIRKPFPFCRNHTNKVMKIKPLNSVAFSLQANYTDWTTSIGRRILVETFVDRRVLRGQRGGTPTVVNLSFLDGSRYFSFKQLLIYPHEAEWTPFQTHCYAGNPVALGTNPGPLGLQPGTLTTRPQRRSENIKRCINCILFSAQ
jgi:hypothetical protein